MFLFLLWLGRYGDKWIVDLLLDDLIDWHDWFHTYRLLPQEEDAPPPEDEDQE